MNEGDSVAESTKSQSEGTLGGAGKLALSLGVECPSFNLDAAAKGQVQSVAQLLPIDGSTLGPQISELERRSREYIGTRYAIAVGSCTAALCIPLVALGVGSGAEVIMSPFGVCAVANIVVRLGANPVFADVDTDYNINPDEIERHITPRTRAIVPTHYGGQPCRMDKILRCGQERGLPVIEDGSQALGSTYRGRKVGAIGDVTAFCLHARTQTMAFSAGIIATNNQALAEAMRTLCQSGEDKWLGDNTDPAYDCTSYATDPGRTDEDWAVCTCPDLGQLDELQKIRGRYARMYSTTLRNVAAFSVPFVWPDVGHAWQVYALRLRQEQLAVDRGGFVEALRGENIEVKAHPLPVHLHPDYRLRSRFQRGEFPVAERMAESIVSLPLTEIMTERDVLGVIAAVKRTADRYRV